MAVRVGILLTHPTQYHSPWFQELAKRTEVDIQVFYCFRPNADQQGTDFGVAFQWDTPLLEGYSSTFLKNVATHPGFHFSGCNTPELRDLVASRKFDAWIINGWKVKSDWQAIKACWQSRIPMLIRGDSHLLDSKPVHLRAAKRMILGRWIPRFSRYLTVGKLNENYYEFYGAEPSKFFPVRHYVDNARFAAESTEAKSLIGALRAKWSITPGATVFLFAGKFIPKKRPLDAIQAIERLRAKNLNIHLLMVGDGILRTQCEEYSSKNGVPVSFTGFLNQGEIAQAYACSDVLILPSGNAETWGLIVNEAMSCGLPAIVSDRVGCGPDLVRQRETGLIFPAGDVDALTHAIEFYARDNVLARRHGENARRHVAGYSVGAAADNTVAAVMSLR